LRLSKIVKTNLQRETEGGNYRQHGQNANVNDEDVTIENNDLELDFAEQTDGDSNDDDEVSDVSACRDSPGAGNEKPISCNSVKEQPCDIQAPSANMSDRNGANDVDYGKGDPEKIQAAVARVEVAATPPGVGLPRRVQRTQIHSDQKKLTMNSPAHGNGEQLKTSLIISQALWHPSDLAVRPIMLYKKGDKLVEPGYDLRSLPCEPITPSDFVKLSAEEMETFINKIVVSISGSSALNEKLNTLKYLETVCANAESANILINGPAMQMLVKMLRTSKIPALRAQVIYAMGLLIRYATLIEEELASTGIIAVLSQGLRDKQDKVRRCSMATLGELLFYIATQNDSSPRSVNGSDTSSKDGKPSSSWQVRGLKNIFRLACLNVLGLTSHYLSFLPFLFSIKFIISFAILNRSQML
jgi:serine/threonine-protein kinase ULK4